MVSRRNFLLGTAGAAAAAALPNKAWLTELKKSMLTF
ncbi:twin-arginine translocation signal domain-containing protein [Photobacterium gaetbulicola]